MGSTWILVSVTRAESERLAAGGPQRDYLGLQAATGAEILFTREGRRRTGLLARLTGPHVRQAWQATTLVSDGDIVFADGEHSGFPLAVFLRLRRKRPARLVLLGHHVSPRWKRRALWLTSRIGVAATLVVHSAEQQEAARRVAGSDWRVVLVPYHADTDFWTHGEEAERASPPQVIAVGSENRDYETLLAAWTGVEGLQLTIAAGSYWARRTATAGGGERGARFITEPLSFAELRTLYRRASAVIVPLHDVENQSGVTTILEAMSVGAPVIVSATRGQRECIRGVLVTDSGELDVVATADRGPQVILGRHVPESATGVYVPPDSVAAMTHAIALARDGELPVSRNEEIRDVARRCFDTRLFIGRIQALLDPSSEAIEAKTSSAGEQQNRRYNQPLR